MRPQWHLFVAEHDLFSFFFLTCRGLIYALKNHKGGVHLGRLSCWKNRASIIKSCLPQSLFLARIPDPTQESRRLFVQETGTLSNLMTWARMHIRNECVLEGPLVCSVNTLQELKVSRNLKAGNHISFFFSFFICVCATELAFCSIPIKQFLSAVVLDEQRNQWVAASHDLFWEFPVCIWKMLTLSKYLSIYLSIYNSFHCSEWSISWWRKETSGENDQHTHQCWHQHTHSLFSPKGSVFTSVHPQSLWQTRVFIGPRSHICRTWKHKDTLWCKGCWWAGRTQSAAKSPLLEVLGPVLLSGD